MRPGIASRVCTGVLFATCAGVACAGPSDSKLLSLVPPGAQILSGYENKPNKAGGPFLMTTVNNVLDLQDWVALAGADPKRGYTEVIEVTFAPAGTSLNEHLVLLKGAFHRDRIFQSAEMNGAKLTNYLGIPLLIVEPFSREKVQMKDVRWLGILDDQVAVFGTPSMVQRAIARFENHSTPDPVLVQRLGLFRQDVSSWSIFASLPKLQQNLFVRSRSPLSTLFDSTELMMVGVRFDKKVRVDVLLQASQEAQGAEVDQKAEQIRDAFTMQTAEGDRRDPQVKSVQLRDRRVEASILLSCEDFKEWKTGQSHSDQTAIHVALARQRNANERASVTPSE